MWKCAVWVHPDELPLVTGNVSTFHAYANPLDRWVILPLLRLMGSKRTEAMVSQASFKDVARPLDLAAGIPGLPDWEVFPTPGHTPGHVAFFRRSDRVLITGDALVTINLNSMWSLLRKEHRVSGPPWYTTWSWRAAKESVACLARARAAGAGRRTRDSHGRPPSPQQGTSSIRADGPGGQVTQVRGLRA